MTSELLHDRFSRPAIVAMALILVSLSLSNLASAEAKETVLHTFACETDGCVPPFQGAFVPQGPLVMDQDGNLYGTTPGGGDPSCTEGEYAGCGTVFELTPDGSGGWNETLLYAFQGGTDGNSPESGVILDAAGNLYGTTYYGGGITNCNVRGCGTVFELSRSGNSWAEQVLYSFTGGSGAVPEAGLVFDGRGNLYGTTNGGGSGHCLGGCGTVFELTPNPNGGWDEKVIHEFGLGTSDGLYPSAANLVFDSRGNLYGATRFGGVYYCQITSCGTIFKLTLSEGVWKKSTIWNFTGGDDGLSPNGVIAHEGALYGTTADGGANGVGTVFQLTPGVGNGTMKLLYAFTGGNDGGTPFTGLVAGGSFLYGSTVYGGQHQYGTVFSLTPGGGAFWVEDVLYNFAGDASGEYPPSPLLLVDGGLIGFATNEPGGLVYEITAR